jgi:hypothetical protein
MKAQGSPRRKTKNPCVVLISEKEYEDNREEDQPLECELQGDDRNGGLYRMVRIHGVTTKWAKNNKLESGLSTLFAQDAEIDDESNELSIPEGSNIQVCTLFMIENHVHIAILPRFRLASAILAQKRAPILCPLSTLSIVE